MKKLGVKRTVTDIRAINRKLHETAPSTYPASAAALADSSLDALERSLRGLREDEAVQKAWSWFVALEADNPTFANALLKTLLDSLKPVRWASTLLMPDKSDASASASSSASSSASASSSTSAPEAASATNSNEAELLIKRATTAVPELEDYHVLLVPKAAFDADDRGRAA